MKSKDTLFKEHEKDYKPLFLLAWAKFLTYEELDKYNLLEAFDAEVAKGCVKTPKDWNRQMVEYNDVNVKKALCIALHQSLKDIIYNRHEMMTIYADDLSKWLYMLDDERCVRNYNLSEYRDIVAFYKRINKKYCFDLNFENID